MIQLLHTITMDRLQNKATPNTTHIDTDDVISNPSSVSMPSSSAEPVVETIPTAATPAPPVQSVQRPIDLGELKSRLQNAYRLPDNNSGVSWLNMRTRDSRNGRGVVDYNTMLDHMHCQQFIVLCNVESQHIFIAGCTIFLELFVWHCQCQSTPPPY